MILNIHFDMYWVGKNKQLGITWTNDDPILKRHMLLLGHTGV